MNDSSDDFENIEPVYSATASASDIADSGSVQLKVLNKVNDMNKKLTPLLSAQSEPPVWFKEYMAQVLFIIFNLFILSTINIYKWRFIC